LKKQKLNKRGVLMFVESRRSQERIAQILRDYSSEDRAAANELFPLVRKQLRRPPRRRLRGEQRAGQAPQTTALIHETNLKFTAQKTLNGESRTYFFVIAPNLMRQFLFDQARAKHRAERGRAADNLPVEKAQLLVAEEKNLDLLMLDEALNKPDKPDEQQTKIVELRYLGGLSIDETPMALNGSEATVNKDRKVVKAWLRSQLPLQDK
jgi:RNA polymerase sigma factor (TIGR02999 family)